MSERPLTSNEEQDSTRILPDAADREPATNLLSDGVLPEGKPSAGTVPLARPAAPVAESADAEGGLAAAVAALEGRVRHLRIAVIALAVVAVLLVASAGALAWQTAELRASVMAGGQQTGTVGVTDNGDSIGSADDTEDEDASEGGIDPENLRAADLLDIVGESWANALRILDSFGVNQADLTLITSDGGMVLNPANWTVTLVSDLDEPGHVAVYLRHDSWGLF